MSNEVALADLKRFAIAPAQIDAWDLTQLDYEMTNRGKLFPGYRIPYYDREGNPINHARIRATDRGDNSTIGYLRVKKDDVSHLYYPPGFLDCAGTAKPIQSGKNIHRPVFIVDDERRAASLVHAFAQPAVAVPGAAGWKQGGVLAEGLSDFIEWAVTDKVCLIIWFDGSEDRNIQRELAELGLELKSGGIPYTHVRQYTELDYHHRAVHELLGRRSAFPPLPNVRSFIQKKLDTNSYTRRDLLDMSVSILADLEMRGFRVRSNSDGRLYYFDEAQRSLTMASIPTISRDLIQHSPFLEVLHEKYGLHLFDHQVLKTIASTLSSEPPVFRTRAHRLLMTTPRFENLFCYQLSASEFVYLDTRENGTARVINNGTNGILFEKSATMPVNVEKFKEELARQRQQLKALGKMPCWWAETLKEVNFAEGANPNLPLVLTLLYYVSPWLLGWCEIQLPIEVVVGEPGSGKSSLFELRLKIQTGEGDLKNVPNDLRSWQSVAVNTPGLFVMDNVHTVIKSLCQGLSDEMCRITTQSTPTIELKQLYTTSDVSRFPLGCAFGLTSVQNVFTNVDFLQRSILTKLEPRAGVEASNYDWVPHKLEQYGGREAWLAHHILVIEQFFKVVEKYWNPQYKSNSRLINFEQTMLMMAKVFGLDASKLPEVLQRDMLRNIRDLEWVLEGLSKFADDWRRKRRKAFKITDVCSWAEMNDEFADNKRLTNPRRLGRYIQENKTTVRNAAGIVVKQNNNRSATYGVE